MLFCTISEHHLKEGFLHRFLHFVASLQSKFYTLAPNFVFDVNIYFSSSRLLTIDPSLRLLQAIHRQYLILALSLPLSRFSTSEYFRAKRLFFCLNLISSTWFQPKAQGQREKVASRENIR